MANHQTPNLPLEGDCYESSFKHALSLFQVKQAVETDAGSEADRALYERLGLNSTILIFHGYATSPGGRDAGKRIHHAWIEVGDTVFETQGGTRQLFTRRAYYGTFSIYPNERFTVDEALNHVTGTAGVTENYGPWRGKGEDICTAT